MEQDLICSGVILMMWLSASKTVLEVPGFSSVRYIFFDLGRNLEVPLYKQAKNGGSSPSANEPRVRAEAQ